MEGKRRYSTDTDVPPYRQQPVTNIVYAVYRTLAAKLTKQKPALEVVPPSGDSDDRESAQLGQSLLTHFWRSLKIPTKQRRALGWFLCAGQVYLRVHWDPGAGKRVPLSQLVEVPDPANPGETIDVDCPCDTDGQPFLRPDGSPDVDKEPTLMPEGECAFDVEDPMAVRYNPEATDADDATEMYVAKLWPRHKAAKHFGVKIEDIEGNSDSDRQMYADLLSSAATGPGWTSNSLLGSSVGASQDEALGDRVLVIEYYHMIDGDRPQGAHWISIGRKQVWPKKGEAPLPNGFWPPLIPVLSLPIPGQPQALGVLPQIVPLNEQLNTLDGKIMEHEVTMAMGGKWVVHPEDKGIVITSDPAQVIASKGYAHGMPPVQAKLNALPDAIYNERAVLMDKVRTVASLSEAEFGTTPEGVTAGRAFLVLQEVTDAPIGPDLQAWEQAFEEVGRRLLKLAQDYYREDRIIQIRGERGKWEVRHFTGADLSDGLDVRVQVGSSAPWSTAAQYDSKLQLLSTFKELVMKPDGTIDEEKFARIMDPGNSGLQSFDSDEDPALVEIDREHDMFENYSPEEGRVELPQRAFWQSDAKHAKGHFEFMQRDRGRFDKWNPLAQKAFEDHMKATLLGVDQMAGTIAAATSEGPAALPPGTEGEAGAPVDDGEPAAAGDLANPNNQPALSEADYASAGASPVSTSP